MNIAIIDDNYNNAIIELNKLSLNLIKIHKYHYMDTNNYFIYIANENLNCSHKPVIHKIIIFKSLEFNNEFKLICNAWAIGNLKISN